MFDRALNTPLLNCIYWRFQTDFVVLLVVVLKAVNHLEPQKSMLYTWQFLNTPLLVYQGGLVHIQGASHQ